MENQFKRFARIAISQCIGNYYRLFRKSKINKGLTVFNYHDVTNDPSEFSFNHDLNVPPSIFELQIKFIKTNFNVISPDDLLQKKIPPRAALITFDDGFSSYFKTAVPILHKYNVPSINFLNMGPIKGEIFWAGLITYLKTTSTEFHKYVSLNSKCNIKDKTIHLHCTRKIVKSFLENKCNSYKDEVNKYVGKLATLKLLKSVDGNKLIFFGNHLYNHDVPILLSDKQLLKSYKRNEDDLKTYSNYRSLFAFPFGQPGSCYSKYQIELLLQNGASNIFSTFPIINYDVTAQYLHRIPLHSFNNSNSRIWYNILRRVGKKITSKVDKLHR